MILCRILILELIRLSSTVSQLSSLSIPVMLDLFWKSPTTYLAALLWTFSSNSLFFFVPGFQAAEAYCRWGFTSMLYSFSLIFLVQLWKFLIRKFKALVARYNWPHSFSCADRCLKRQISCHNKRYIQLSQLPPCTDKVQTRNEYWNLYVTMLWSYHVVESSGCKHGGKRCSLLWQKHPKF